MEAHINFGSDPRPVLKKFGYCVVKKVFTKKEKSVANAEISPDTLIISGNFPFPSSYLEGKKVLISSWR